MERKVIICCAARNELHNLARLVPAWRLYADHIIIADQNSTDGSREFLSKFHEVQIIHNDDTEFNEDYRCRLLTEKARSICKDAALLYIDADETLSANVTTSLEWKSFLSSEPGTTGFFPWITLWGSCRRYIRDGRTGGPTHIAFAFIDDGRPVQGTKKLHGPRGPGLINYTRRFYFNDVVNLHFFLSNNLVYSKKQAWYKYYWIDKGGKYFHANRNHCLYEHITVDDTNISPREWTDNFCANGIDLSSVSSPELLWYDVDLLQYFHRNGSRRLWLADIWHQDWEHLRKIAIDMGHKDIPLHPIELPPKWVIFYVDFTLGRITLRAKLRSLGRFLKRKILP